MLRKATVLSLMISFVLGSTVQAAPEVNQESPTLENLRKIYEENHGNLQAAHDYAVALAREGQYTPALVILQQLAAPANASLNVLFDYVTTAVWAGDYAGAVQTYETRIKARGKDVPEYVKTNVAGAYFQLGKYQEAWEIYHAAAAGGDQKIKLWEAESLARLGRITDASQLYDELVCAVPANVDIYLSRAEMYLMSGDNLSASKDIETVIKLQAEQGQGSSLEKELQLRGNLAARFIRDEAYEYAILLLKPSIKNGSATPAMQQDYVYALFLNGDYKTAVEESARFWPDLSVAPLYVRRAVADSYLRMNQLQKAIPIYRGIVADTDSRTSDKQSLAYAYVLKGDLKNGVALYKELIDMGVEQADHVTFDGNALLERGHHEKGILIYKLVMDKYPDNSIFRQRFAADLYQAKLTREAYEQYAILGKLPDGQPAAAVGIVNTAVPAGDYAAARPAVDYLKTLPKANPAVGQAISRFERRFMGNVVTAYIMNSDYKGNDVRFNQLTGEQRVSDRMSVVAGAGHKKVTDNDGTSSLDTFSVGGKYTSMKSTMQLMLDRNRDDGHYSGYRFNATRYFGDHTSLDLSINRAPVEDAQALTEGIMSREYRIGLNRQLGRKDLFSLGLGKAYFTDTNGFKAIDIDWVHTMKDNDKKTLEWLTYFRRTDYDLQLINGVEPVYESPSTREEYGAGIRGRWMYTKHYWEGTLVMEWGRDRPEPIDFTPYARLEYGHTFSPWQSLVLGAEYGLRTGRSTNTGTNLQFGYRQYDISYRLNW